MGRTGNSRNRAPAQVPAPPQQSVIARAVAELAATGQISDETFSRLRRALEEASDDELQALLEQIGRPTPTLPPLNS